MSSVFHELRRVAHFLMITLSAVFASTIQTGDTYLICLVVVAGGAFGLFCAVVNGIALIEAVLTMASFTGLFTGILWGYHWYSLIGATLGGLLGLVSGFIATFPITFLLLLIIQLWSLTDNSQP